MRTRAASRNTDELTRIQRLWHKYIKTLPKLFNQLKKEQLANSWLDLNVDNNLGNTCLRTVKVGKLVCFMIS